MVQHEEDDEDEGQGVQHVDESQYLVQQFPWHRMDVAMVERWMLDTPGSRCKLSVDNRCKFAYLHGVAPDSLREEEAEVAIVQGGVAAPKVSGDLLVVRAVLRDDDLSCEGKCELLKKYLLGKIL